MTQRHEVFGTRKIYHYFDKKDINVEVHTSDMNMGVRSMMKKQRPEVKHEHERWHGPKNLKKQVAKVTTGLKCKQRITWHDQLTDKLEPICTHAYYSIDHCAGSAKKLKANLLNYVEHYKNNLLQTFP